MLRDSETSINETDTPPIPDDEEPTAREAVLAKNTPDYPPFPKRPDLTWNKLEGFITYQIDKLQAMGIVPPEPLPDRAEEYARLLVLASLESIGPEKPAGYLPIRTLTDICNKDVDATKQELENKGLKTILMKEDASKVSSGALYAYDEEALQKLLDENAPVLDRVGWPKDPDAFLRRASIEIAKDAELFKLIAWAYADPRPEYQRPGPTPAQ